MSTESHADFWLRRARSLRRLINLGWYWLYAGRLLLAAACVAALLCWLLRVQRVSAAPAVWLGAGMALASMIGALEPATRKRISMKTALSRLDVGWGLDHRLVSAMDGVGSWPEPDPSRPLPLRWRWNVWLPPVGLGAAMLMLAALLPLPELVASPPGGLPEPPDWSALEELADELEQQDLAREEDARELREEVERLREKPEETWYQPSSLEATDELRTRARADSRRLEEGLRQTARLMELAAARGEELTPEQREAMQRRLEEMRQRMEQNGMRPGEQAGRDLQQVDLSQLSQMDAAQLQQLEQQLRQQSQALREAMRRAGLGEGEEGGLMAGSGGVDRGGGPSPLTLEDFESAVPPAVPMALEGGDPEDARLGDLLDVTETEHDEERADVAERAGTVASPGGGGEVVWRQEALPTEEKVLQDYFR